MCITVYTDMNIISDFNDVKKGLNAIFLSFGIGSEKHPIELEDVGETIDD